MIRVLVADDSNGWRNYHKKMLSEISSEFDITICDWARDAYEKVFENLDNPFDLIITDLQMESDFEPDYAGEWLIQRVRELNSYRNVPILIISATYNINFIADKFGVDCLPKSTAVNSLLSYKHKIEEILKREF
ncbi:response regulator [bacterium]|nr:response regulator [bacterium]